MTYPNKANNFDAIFNCTEVGRATGLMTDLSLIFHGGLCLTLSMVGFTVALLVVIMSSPRLHFIAFLEVVLYCFCVNAVS